MGFAVSYSAGAEERSCVLPSLCSKPLLLLCPSQKAAGVWAHGSVRTLRPEVGQ